MNYSKEKIEKKYVIGVPVRTTNEDGHFLKDVPPLWERFHRERLAEKIPDRLNHDLLAVYTDYESDYTKPFTYIIGCEVKSLTSIPDEMIGIEIPPAEYALFTAKGEFPKSMMLTWQNIWRSGIQRSYTTDFEIYASDFNPQNNPIVRIYIAT